MRLKPLKSQCGFWGFGSEPEVDQEGNAKSLLPSTSHGPFVSVSLPPASRTRAPAEVGSSPPAPTIMQPALVASCTS